jgi:hypothetical protein
MASLLCSAKEMIPSRWARCGNKQSGTPCCRFKRRLTIKDEETDAETE